MKAHNWPSYQSLTSDQKDEHKLRAIAWNKAHPEERKIFKHRHAMKRRYGLSGYEYEVLMLCQGGFCGICSKQIESEGELHVDHNHETGMVRGFLCGNCNLGLGKIGESNLLMACDYVRGF